MPGSGPGAEHAASVARRERGDEEALRGDVVKLASRYGRYGYRRVTALLQCRGLGGEPQAGGADLAAGGAEGAQEAAEAWPAVAERRIVHPAEAHAPGQRVVVRFHDGAHAQRAGRCGC